jgi:hypothetical protein
MKHAIRLTAVRVFITVVLVSLILPLSVKVYAAAGDETSNPQLTLVTAIEAISVSSSFSGDNNGNNHASLYYRRTGTSTWKPGIQMTVDRRSNLVIYSQGTITNPYRNQWRAIIFGLTPNTSYDVRVDYTDVDGGSGSVQTTVTTRNNNPPSNGNIYYVSTSGNDSSGNGSQSSPWRTIQKAANSVSPGDRVRIMPGTYNEQVTISTSGTVNNYITFESYDANNKAIVTYNNIEGTFRLNGTDYIRIKNLGIRTTADNGQCIRISNNAIGNIVEGCTIDVGTGNNWWCAGIWLHGDGGGNSPSYTLIQNNSITTQAIGHDGPFGVLMYQCDIGGTTIKGNTIAGGYWDGISTIPNFGIQNVGNFFIYNNSISGCYSDCIEVEGGGMNVGIWNNTITDPFNMTIASAPCIIGPLYVFRNVFTGSPDGLAAFKLGSSSYGSIYIYQNTLYKVRGSGFATFGSDGTADNIFVRNNIVEISGGSQYLIEEYGNCLGTWDFDYDVMYTPRSQHLKWMGIIMTWSDWRANYNREAHGLWGQEHFVNADAGNFNLQSNAIGIDRGVILQGFNDVNSPWPYSGNAPDIGAFEYTGAPAQDTTPPYTTGHSPQKYSSSAAPDTNIVVHVCDTGSGVDQSSIEMRINSSLVSPTITGTSYDYTLTYNPPTDFSYGQRVNITIDASDLESNDMNQDSYYFTVVQEEGGGEPEPPSGDFTLPFRVNCGGSAYTDSSGKLWNADQGYVSGSWGYTDGSTTTRNVAISNTQDDPLYQVIRYDLTGYQFDLSNGTYDITLLFAENYKDGTGDRVFDVIIEGQLKLDNLDIYARAGNYTALIETISGVAVYDRQLNIEFDPATSSPTLICGIMISASGAGGNQSPVAVNNSYSTAPDTTLYITAPGILGNDNDANGDTLTAVLVSNVSHGDLTLNPNGAFSYTPDGGYTGTDSFSYRANDGKASSNIAVVSLNVSSGSNGGTGGGTGGSSGGGTGGSGGSSGDETDNVEITSVMNSVNTSGMFTETVTARSSDDNVSINIPKDTVGTNVMGLRLLNIRIEKMTTNSPGSPDDAEIIGWVYNITPDGASFSPAIKFTMNYIESQVPDGVSEKNLVIGNYDPSTGVWHIIPSSTNLANNEVSANLEHFSIYAILAYTNPASFKVEDISTYPDIVTCGNNIDIQATITNTGDLIGDYEVCLMLDGEIFERQLITLEGGDSTIVTFSTVPDIAGVHTISIGSVEETFTAERLITPAEFITSNISVTPQEIYLGDSIDISTLISNIGDLPGTHEVIVKMDNEIIDSKNLNIGGHDSEIIIFSIKPETEGEHAISIGEKVVFFTVKSTLNVDPEIVAMAKPEISRFDITPTYSPGTGKIDSTRIDYQLRNTKNLDPGSMLILKVFREGELWEEITLLTLNQLGTDEDAGYLSYVPQEGWGVGTYIFEAELQSQSGVVQSIQFEKFTLIEESITRAISWGSLGIIIGGTLIVLLSVLAIVIYRRRDMLRGYVE